MSENMYCVSVSFSNLKKSTSPFQNLLIQATQKYNMKSKDVETICLPISLVLPAPEVTRTSEGDQKDWELQNQNIS